MYVLHEVQKPIEWHCARNWQNILGVAVLNTEIFLLMRYFRFHAGFLPRNRQELLDRLYVIKVFTD